MVMTLLPLVILSRALQANHYGLFVLQTSLCFVLLAESLAQDWHLAEVRLLNALIGEIYDSVLHPESWNETLARITRLRMSAGLLGS